MAYRRPLKLYTGCAHTLVAEIGTSLVPFVIFKKSLTYHLYCN